MKLWLTHARVAGTVALLGALSGSCSKQPSPSPPPVAVPSSSPAAATEKHRDLELAAQLEIANLRDMRFHTSDRDRVELIDRQIAEIERWREALLHDATALRAEDRARVPADESNLERALQAGASAEVQAMPPQRVRQTTGTPPGDHESMPPGR